MEPREFHCQRVYISRYYLWLVMSSSRMPQYKVSVLGQSSVTVNNGERQVLVTPLQNTHRQCVIDKAILKAATAITSALSPKPIALPSSVTPTSPARLIESRSKLYKQLADLQNLKTAGILTGNEYFAEKATIMELLHKLKPSSN